jgi:hypothetical protein
MSCTVQDAGEFVQVLVGPAPSPSIRECYRDLVSLCTQHRIPRALLISSDGDATGHAAMREAIDAMAAAGLGPDFRLAMVAQPPQVFSVYQSAEKVAAGKGLAARAFRTRREAVEWLSGPASRGADRSDR